VKPLSVGRLKIREGKMSVVKDRIGAVAIAVLLVMTVFGCSQKAPPVPSFQNEPEGFRGIRWGTKITRLPGMELVRVEGDEKYYVRPEDKLKIGKAVIESITYGFYRDDFFKVTIRVKGLMNYLDLKQTFVEVYGDGENVFGKDFYAWSGKQVLVTIEFKTMLNEGEALYAYKPITEKMNKETGRKITKGAGDL